MKKNLMLSLLLCVSVLGGGCVYGADGVAPAAESTPKTDFPKKELEVDHFKFVEGKFVIDETQPKFKFRYFVPDDTTILTSVKVKDKAIIFFNFPTKSEGPSCITDGKGELPPGHKLVNIWMKKKTPEEKATDPSDPKNIYDGLFGSKVVEDYTQVAIHTEGADGNLSAAPDGYDLPARNYWVLMNEKTHVVYIPEVEIDTVAHGANGEKAYVDGTPVWKQDFIKTYQMPDDGNTQKLKGALDQINKAMQDKDAAMAQLKELAANPRAAGATSGGLLSTIKLGNIRFKIVPEDDACSPQDLELLKAELPNFLSENPQVGAMSIKDINFDGKDIKDIALQAIKVSTKNSEGQTITATLLPVGASKAEKAQFVQQIIELFNAKKAGQAGARELSDEDKASIDAAHQAKLDASQEAYAQRKAAQLAAATDNK